MTTGIPALAGAIYAERALLQETPLQDALHTLLLKALSGPKSLLGGAAEPRWARLPLLACASASNRGAGAAVELQAAAYRLLDALEDGDAGVLSHWPHPAVACNVATTLLALAQRALFEVPALVAAVVADGWVGVCVGQHRDLTLDLGDPDPLGTALLAAEGKTGMIAPAAMEAGALAGGADITLAARYRRFGHAVGLAGQFANDLLGLAPGPRGATDVSRGQRTLPILFALVGVAPAVRTCLERVRADEPIPPALHGHALAELAAIGADRYIWLLLEGARRDAAAALAEIVRLFGLRIWVEQSYQHVKYALGWGEYQVRSDRAIRRHWILVWCAFSFCWLHQCDSAPPSANPAHPVESGLDAPQPPALASGGENQPATIQPIAPAQRLMASGPADRARLAGTLTDALALLEGVVAAAPATVAPHAA